MSPTLSPAMKELFERAETACEESRRTRRECEVLVTDAHETLRRLEAVITDIDWVALRAWRRD